MPVEPRVVALLAQYEECLEAGHAITPEELCRDTPDLLGPLRQGIQALRALGSVLGTGNEVAVSTAGGPPPEIDAIPEGPEGVFSGVRYGRVRFHARGGLGEVFVAEDEGLRREVALKRLQIRHDRNPASRRRFLLEAEVTGRLEHPGVVPVYGLGQDAEGRPCYAMRFIRGESFQDALCRFHQPDQPGRLEYGPAFRQLLGRLVAVCNTVAYAHSRGVLHRDLKPGNVMLGSFGETLVVDWGLAKVVGQEGRDSADQDNGSRPSAGLTRVGTIVGTPQYMSPEQASGRPEGVGMASDVYALGAMLYVLLSGRLPFEGHDTEQILEKVRRGDFPVPRRHSPGVPRALEAVCLKAMARKPEERYASALALADDLERWLAGEPVGAWREPWAVRARRWLGRHRTLVTATAATTVAAGLILTAATVLLSAAYRKEQQARQETLRQDEEVRKQRDEARRHRDEARQQRDEAARAFFHLARLTAEGVAQEEAIGVYERAIKLYERLARDNPSDRGYRSGLAKSCHNLALLYEQHRGRRRAEAMLTQARELFDALARETWDEAGLVGLLFHLPEAIGCQFSLGKIHMALGDVCFGSDREKEAEDHLRKALALLGGLEGLVGPALLRYEQARCFDALGEVLAATGRPGPAEEAYKKAETFLRELAARPRSADRQARLARTLTSLAALWVEAKRFNDAAASLSEARKIMARLTGDNPNVFRFKAQYARVHFVSGKMLIAAGRERVAEQAFRAALALQEPLVQEHPTNIGYKLELVSTCKRLADACRTTAPDQAESMYRKVVDLSRQLTKDHPEGEYTLGLAESLATFGAFLLLTKRPEPALASLDEAIATLKARPQQGPGQKKMSAALAKFQRIRAITLDVLKKSRSNDGGR